MREEFLSSGFGHGNTEAELVAEINKMAVMMAAKIVMKTHGNMTEIMEFHSLEQG